MSEATLRTDETWLGLIKELTEAVQLLTPKVKGLKYLESNPVLYDQLIELFESSSAGLPLYLESSAWRLWKLIREAEEALFPPRNTVRESLRELLSQNDLKKREIKNLFENIITGYVSPEEGEVLLSKKDLQLLDRVAKFFHDLAEKGLRLRAREDNILAALPRNERNLFTERLDKIAEFCGLVITEIPTVDIGTGRTELKRFFQFEESVEQLLVEEGYIRPSVNQESIELVKGISIELFLSIIQAWRSVYREKLDSHTVNFECGFLALNIIIGIVDGETFSEKGIEVTNLPRTLLNVEILDGLILPLTKAVAYVLNRHKWLEQIYVSDAKRKTHRQVRANLMEVSYTLRLGMVRLLANSIQNRIRQQRVQFQSELQGGSS